MATVAELLARHVELHDSDSPRLDAELLLAHSLRKSRSYLYAFPEAEVPPEAEAQYSQRLQCRARGEPVAYLLGERGFLDFSVRVTPAVLVPRPETELLVEQALACTADDTDILDLGTGSGIIALALARARPHSRVCAVDASHDALAVAADNAEQLNVRNIRFLHSNWFAALPPQRFHTIVSNPPYIAEGDEHLRALRHEPQQALVAAETGFADLFRIISGATAYLHDEGWLWLEHGTAQGEAVRRHLQQAGYVNIRTECDLVGHERATGAQWHAD